MKEQKIPICTEQKIHPCEIERAGQHMPAEEDLFSLAELFKVFGDSTRIKILFALFESELCVCDIANLLSMSKSAISHQLNDLKAMCLVTTEKKGKEIFYSLCDRYGIIVWQDFMLSCSEASPVPFYRNQIKEEAVYQIKRLNAHPSVCIWCGG